MITVYFSDKDDPENVIDGFEMPAVPRIGDCVFISYSRMLRDRNRYTVESLMHAEEIDGTDWVVLGVAWEASYGGDGRVTVTIEREAKQL